MRSQRGEKELGLFLLPYRFLWVPPTSGNSQKPTIPGTCRRSSQHATEESRGWLVSIPAAGAAVSAEPGSTETLGKEAEEWPAWVFILLGRREIYWEEEKAFPHSCPCFPLK